MDNQSCAKRTLSDADISTALRRYRSQLKQLGAQLTKRDKKLTKLKKRGVWTIDDLYKATEQGMTVIDWSLISRLRWKLQSDGIISPEYVKNVLSGLNNGDKFRLLFSLRAASDALANTPGLSTYNRDELRQFAALGKAWFDALVRDPQLGLYLKKESQGSWTSCWDQLRR
jgi:hypothetical protein